MNIDQTTFNAVSLTCKRQQRTLFSNLSFELAQGELLLIEGANGSGKSSLLRLLSGLAQPAQGEILWQGRSIQQTTQHFFADMHYVSHANGIKLGLTVEENLQLLCHPRAGGDLSRRIPAFAGITLDAGMTAKNLSAGQKRKLGLAKLFLVPKKLWILDEPLTALDVEMQQIFLTALEKHLRAGGMAIMSSHHKINVKAKKTSFLRMQEFFENVDGDSRIRGNDVLA